MLDITRKVHHDLGNAIHRALPTKPLTIGQHGCMHNHVKAKRNHYENVVLYKAFSDLRTKLALFRTTKTDPFYSDAHQLKELSDSV